MKKIGLLIPIFVLVLSVLACSYGAKPIDKVSYAELPSNLSQSYVGGYVAEVFDQNWITTSPQYYYWSQQEVVTQLDDCVTVGRLTVKITLYAVEKWYEWVPEGENFCLRSKSKV